MKRRVYAAAAAVALAGCSAQQPAPDNRQAAMAQRPSDAQSDAYMRKAEEDWAALAVRKIPGLLERIMADDYVGVSSKGDVRSKADQLRLDTGPDGTYVASKLDYVHYRHFGDTVIAQGGETLTGRDHKNDMSLIWTDVWMFRDGNWQVVASQDLVLPKKK